MKKQSNLYDYFDRTSIILALAYFAINAFVLWGVILTSIHDISVTDPSTRVFFSYNPSDTLRDYTDVLQLPSADKLGHLVSFMREIKSSQISYSGVFSSFLELVNPSHGGHSAILPSSIQRTLQAKFAPSQQVIDLHNRPRTNPLTGEPAPNTMTPSLEYIMGLVGLIIFPLVLAVLAPISLICFCILRCCCGCCGGWGADSEGYDEDQIKKSRIALGLVSATILITSFVGLGGNTAFREGIEAVFDSVAAVAAAVVKDVEAVINGIAGLALLGGTAALGQQGVVLDSSGVVDLSGFSDSITSQADAFKAIVLEFDGYRSTGIIFAFIFAIGLGAIGGVCTAAMIAGLPLLVAALAAWLGSLFVWIAYAIHYPLAVLSADVCITFSTISANAVNNPTMNFMLPCSGGIAATFETLLTNIKNFQANITTLAVAQPGNATQFYEVRDSLDGAVAALERLAGCKFIEDLVAALHDSICIKMLGGFITIADCFGVIGAMFIFFAPACLIAMKRFKSSNKGGETAIAGMGGEVDTEMDAFDNVAGEEKVEGQTVSAPMIDPETGMIIPQ